MGAAAIDHDISVIDNNIVDNNIIINRGAPLLRRAGAGAAAVLGGQRIWGGEGVVLWL